MPPWEKYQDVPAAPDGPWAKYGAPPSADGEKAASWWFQPVEPPDAQHSNEPPDAPVQPAPSLVQGRDRLRELFRGAETQVINALAPRPDAGATEKLIRRGITTVPVAGLRMLGTAAEQPFNVAIGIQEGPQVRNGQLTVPGATINPDTGTLGVTPEAGSVVQLGANPLRFGGGKPTYVPPGTFDRRPDLSGVNPLLSTVRTQAAERGAGPTSPTGIPEPPRNALLPTTEEVGEAIRRNEQQAPAGAQVTPSAAATISPEEAAAYRSVAEIQKLREPQPVGVPDRRQLVPGEIASTVETEQSAEIAREFKALRNANPKVVDMEKLVADHNNEKRANFLDTITKSDIDLRKAQVDREARGDVNAAEAWRNKTDADGQPVVDFANKVLSGPDGKRDVIVKQIGAIRDKMFNSEGRLETDPEILYGIRKDINDKLSKEAQRDDPTSQRAAGLLIQMRDVLDGQIEAAAPGFKKYLQEWHNDSLPIDQMGVLQSWAPKLFDSKGKLSFSKFAQMMREAVISRRKDMPLNDWQSLTDEQIGQLWDLRDSLRRSASAEELAAAKGSDTAPNAMDIARHAFRLGGLGTAHVGANLAAPGVGSMAVRAGQELLNPLFSAWAGRRQVRRAEELLSPRNDLLQQQPPP